MHWIFVINSIPGEVTRPGGDGPHQGQASVQRASSNHRFCQGDYFLDFNIFLTNHYLRLASQLLVWWTLTATPTLSPTQCLAMTIVRTLSKCSSTSPNRLLWRAKIRGSWNNSNNLLLMFPELGGFRDGKGNGGVVLKRKR